MPSPLSLTLLAGLIGFGVYNYYVCSSSPSRCTDKGGLSGKQRRLVAHSWAVAMEMGETPLGVLLFRTLFTQAPFALKLFEDLRDIPPSELYDNAKFKDHATGVISTLNAGVQILDKPAALKPFLNSLGKRHVEYGVVPAHYDALKAALFETLRQAVGEERMGEEDVVEAWTVVFEMIRDEMVGDNYELLSQAAAY